MPWALALLVPFELTVIYLVARTKQQVSRTSQDLTIKVEETTTALRNDMMSAVQIGLVTFANLSAPKEVPCSPASAGLSQPPQSSPQAQAPQ
jgi:hypothetical protein